MKPTHVLDRALDAAIDCRVELHELRHRGDIDVATYIEGLRQVCLAEDALEPIRHALGATTSRAFEVATREGAEA